MKYIIYYLYYAKHLTFLKDSRKLLECRIVQGYMQWNSLFTHLLKEWMLHFWTAIPIFKYCFDWSVSCMILSLLQDYGKPHWNKSHRTISWLLMKPNHIELLVNSGAFFARYSLCISQCFEKYKSRVNGIEVPFKKKVFLSLKWLYFGEKEEQIKSTQLENRYELAYAVRGRFVLIGCV